MKSIFGAILLGILLTLVPWSALRAQSPPIVDVVVNDRSRDIGPKDTQSETAIVRGSGSNLIALYNNTAVTASETGRGMGFARSTDGGATWIDGGPLPNAKADPVLARDELRGNVYAAALMLNAGNGVQVLASTDDGATWSAPVNAAPGFAADDRLDKPWMAVDERPGTLAGTIYLVFNNATDGEPGTSPGGVYLTKSTDGGLTWQPNGGQLLVAAGFPKAAAPWVTVDRTTHHVQVFWYDATIEPRRIRMRTSTDFGASFGPMVTAATLHGKGAKLGDLSLNGGFRSNSFPQAVSNNGNAHLYAVHNDKTDAINASIVHTFSGGADGAYPSSLIKGFDGNYYGTLGATASGWHGGIFKMTPSGEVTVLYEFLNAADGFSPLNLTEARDGTFYGMTMGGGNKLCRVYYYWGYGEVADWCGTIFKMTPHRTPNSDGTVTTTYTVTTLHRFNGADGDVMYSLGPLLEAADGYLYGMTYFGGGNCDDIWMGSITGCGTIFRMSPSGVVTTLHRFDFFTTGAVPMGRLIQARDGSIYGTTQSGGSGYRGTVFRMTPGGAVTVLQNFNGTNGAYPYGGLVEDADGNLYGTTGGDGGYYAYGTIFKITPGGALTTLHYFNGVDGRAPEHSLVLGRDGNLYGTSRHGGVNDRGVVFKIAPDGDFAVVHRFAGGLQGEYPWGPLVVNGAGSVMGTAGGGLGPYGNGVVYRVGQDSDVFFTMSTNNGSTWETPVALNTDTTTRDQFMPTIAVTPDGSRVFAAWYDRRADPENLSIERWGVMGTVSGDSIVWGPNFRISGGSFPVAIDQDPVLAGNYMGDYDLAVADNEYFYTTWSDNRLPSAAHEHQPDVRFARIPVGGLLVVPTATTGSASDVAADSATLHGTVNPRGSSAIARFEYGVDTTYGSTSFGHGVGAATNDVSVAQAIGNLTCNTQYHFRMVATVAEVVVRGTDAVFTTAACPPPPPPPRRLTDADFDGDGKTDLALYRPSTGTWEILKSSDLNASPWSVSWGETTDIPVLGDFDGDGTFDIAAYRPSTGEWLIIQSSTNIAATVSISWAALGSLPAPADYDGDGRTDIAVFDPSSGLWSILASSTNNSGSFSFVLGTAGDLPVPADFDGDGKADIATFQPSTALWSILTSSSFYSASLSIVFQNPGERPVPGDYNGDGAADLGVFDPATGTWTIQSVFSPFTASYTLGISGDIPVPGDYDGDQATDIAVYRPSTGEWLIQTATTFVTSIGGESTDLPLLERRLPPPPPPLPPPPVAGDFDGDRTTDLALYRPSTSSWEMLTSAGAYSSPLSIAWGESTDIPVTGDYDGDGVMDIAAYRPVTGDWLILQSSTNFTSSITVLWGGSEFLPVPGDYDGDRRTDVALYSPSSGLWGFLKSSTGNSSAWISFFDLGNGTPVPADYDGDQKTDIAMFDPSSATWRIWTSSSGWFDRLLISWGDPDGVAVPGDYDGDGVADLGVYQGSSGQWKIYSRVAGTFADFNLGITGDIPVPGDYDGDGTTDIAVYRPVSGEWHIRLGNVPVTYTFGNSLDLPILRRPAP